MANPIHDRMKAFLLLLSVSSLSLFGQPYLVQLQANIEQGAFEVSGIALTSDGRILVLGDSGNLPQIHQINQLGALLHSCTIQNAVNVDWEELQIDDAGAVYIGDTGNNLSNRGDLKLYKLPDATACASNDTAIAEIIHFRYPDQEWPASPDPAGSFDSEAFFVYQGTVHLFSKDRGFPGQTKYYTFSAQPGNHEAVIQDSRDMQYWITGCWYDQPNDVVYLCSDRHLGLLHDFSVSGLQSELEWHVLPTEQVEGISLLNPYSIWLVEDVETGADSRLYHAAISRTHPQQPVIFPNPASSTTTLQSPISFDVLELFSLSGTKIMSEEYLKHRFFTVVSVSSLNAGVYLVKVSSSKSGFQGYLKLVVH